MSSNSDPESSGVFTIFLGVRGVWVIVECRVSRLGGRGRGFEVEVEVKKSRSRLKSRGRGFEVEVEVLKSRSRLKSRGRG